MFMYTFLLFNFCVFILLFSSFSAAVATLGDVGFEAFRTLKEFKAFKIIHIILSGSWVIPYGSILKMDGKGIILVIQPNKFKQAELLMSPGEHKTKHEFIFHSNPKWEDNPLSSLVILWEG